MKYSDRLLRFISIIGDGGGVRGGGGDVNVFPDDVAIIKRWEIKLVNEPT